MSAREVDLPDTWTITGGYLHGGRLLELLGGEAVAAVGHPHPVAVSAHYVAAPAVGPATVGTEVLRDGRTVANVRTSLVQDGRTRVEALVSCGTLPTGGAPRVSDAVPPEMPPPERCRESVSDPADRNRLLEQLEVRLDPATAGFLDGVPGGSAVSRAWMRSRDGRQPDPLQLLCIADALPPVTFELGLRGWVPTIELTVLLRGVPAPGWLRVQHRAQLVQDGWLDEDCEVYDSTGRLVAQARQLAMYREA